MAKASKEKAVTGKKSTIVNLRASNTGTESAGGLKHGVDARSMPESLAAEAAVLGSMIIDPVCISDVVEHLKTEAFYRIEHQMIFDALISLYEKNRGDAIDAVLLRDELEKRRQLEDVGGVEYLAKVMDSAPSSANAMYYAGIVKDKQLLRELIAAAGEILNDAYSGNGEPNEKLDEAERKIFSVTDKNISGSATGLKDLVARAYELIEKRKDNQVTGLATGYYALDEMTCGLQEGEMIIIAGRPSMGKTSLALNIAEHIGVIEKMPVAIFSLETGKQQLAERFLCSKSGIDAQRVRKGMLDTEHYEGLVKACGELSEAPIYIDDTSSLTPLELRAKARRLKSQRGIRCIMVDYLQLMHLGTNRVESRQQEITTISRYMKALARELSVPVVMLSQLNRSPEGREGHRPRMSDLRESGSIEQDADVVMLLHREDYYHRGEKDYEDDNKAELIIAKQRNGPTGNVELVFRERFTKFENASYASVEGETREGAPF
ncbi:MAG: replicative DNA helicase [Phycisphaerae bacterium]|nr:replicative DNA helicase [Phycisphaerae bacterium]MDD5380459.1 replicative DNA helicase [Phycisphaerae bacterium]